MATEKNWIQGPLEPQARVIVINGIPLILVADLPEGGFVQVVNGENPMAQAVPGPQLLKGVILVAVPVEMAQNMRPQIRAAIAAETKALGQPGVIGGRVVAPSAFDKPDPDFGLTH